MDNPYSVILLPLMTEKMTRLRENSNKYAFRVNPRANKIEIKKAVEKIYNVKVLSVNVMPRKGKERRLGWNSGRTPDWKRAIVTLQEGDFIDIYSGAE